MRQPDEIVGELRRVLPQMQALAEIGSEFAGLLVQGFVVEAEFEDQLLFDVVDVVALCEGQVADRLHRALNRARDAGIIVVFLNHPKRPLLMPGAGRLTALGFAGSDKRAFDLGHRRDCPWEARSRRDPGYPPDV